MEVLIQEFLNKKNVIAIVGVSKNPEKYGYKIFKDLKDFGYKVIPINPKEEMIYGEKVYHILAEVQEKINVVNFVIPPEKTLMVLQECLNLGLKNVWFQPGSSDDAVERFCEENGFRYVSGQCMMIMKNKVRTADYADLTD
jgi:hypothetical protein